MKQELTIVSFLTAQSSERTLNFAKIYCCKKACYIGLLLSIFLRMKLMN